MEIISTNLPERLADKISKVRALLLGSPANTKPANTYPDNTGKSTNRGILRKKYKINTTRFMEPGNDIFTCSGCGGPTIFEGSLYLNEVCAKCKLAQLLRQYPINAG